MQRLNKSAIIHKSQLIETDSVLGRDTEPKEKQDGEYSRQDLKSKGRIELGLQQLLKLTS